MFVCDCTWSHFLLYPIWKSKSSHWGLDWIKYDKIKSQAEEKRAFSELNATNVTLGWQVLQHSADKHIRSKRNTATNVMCTQCDLTPLSFNQRLLWINFFGHVWCTFDLHSIFKMTQMLSVEAHMSSTWSALIERESFDKKVLTLQKKMWTRLVTFLVTIPYWAKQTFLMKKEAFL